MQAQAPIVVAALLCSAYPRRVLKSPRLKEEESARPGEVSISIVVVRGGWVDAVLCCASLGDGRSRVVVAPLLPLLIGRWPVCR